jgi:excisionase family DNA binding protein
LPTDRYGMAAHVERARLLGELETIDPENDGGNRLLRTREVAMLFQVSERAVTDWAARGRLPSVRTPGGHRRYPAGAVRELLDQVGLR